jgi:hypothetical protein
MTYDEFLARVIDDGIEAARADYTKPEEDRHLKGSIAGFEACRGKNSPALVVLLGEARKRTAEAYARTTQPSYWYLRCYELEVEWVANCVSALLVNQGGQALTSYQPTARAVMKLGEIVGITEKAASTPN